MLLRFFLVLEQLSHPLAVSMSTMPDGVKSNTARSVIKRWTTFCPVNGKGHIYFYLGLTILIYMFHNNDNPFGTVNEIHCSTHSFDHLTRNHPISRDHRFQILPCRRGWLSQYVHHESLRMIQHCQKTKLQVQW